MGRRLREEEEGGIYHVIQRGNNREFVFGEEDDKEYLTGQFMLLGGRGCRVYGFVIMGNHYHIVLRTVGETLQSIMHRLNLKYSYFQLTSSSYHPPKVSGLNWNDCPESFGMGVRFRLEYAETGDNENKTIIGEIPVKRKSKEIREKITWGKDLDEILMATGVNEEEFKLIKSGARRRNLTGYKLKYAREALRLNYTLKAIGENIKVSDVAILDMLKRNNLVT